MSKSIWRFIVELPPTGHPFVTMPAGAELLSAKGSRGRNEDIEVWAVVDPDAVLEKRELRVVGTGRDLPEDLGAFLDTVSLCGGGLIFHVFEAAP